MPFTGKPVTQIQQCGIKINDNEVDRNEFRPWIIVFLSAEHELVICGLALLAQMKSAGLKIGRTQWTLLNLQFFNGWKVITFCQHCHG